MELTLNTHIQYVKKVGPKVSKVLKNIGVETVEDLLTLAPTRYVKRSKIKEILPEEEVSLRGRILAPKIKHSKKGDLFEIKLQDETGIITCIFFNYSHKQIAKFKPNLEIEVEGKVSLWRKRLYLVNPEVSFSFFTYFEEKYLPIYPLSEWLTHRYLRKIVHSILSTITIPDFLPFYLILEENLLPKNKALLNLHFPSSLKLLHSAKRRLEFEEMFWLQLVVMLRKKHSQIRGIQFKKGSKLAGKFLALLKKEKEGFELTSAQKKACWDIFTDMEKPLRMNRLLQGDVGAGKTVVGIFAMLKAVENGYQVAFMSPTEVLAEQHFINLEYYLKRLNVKTALLVGKLTPKQKKKILQELKEGEIKIAVGTHALIEENVSFKRLGLVIIDEQHKFGVLQRLRLVKKSKSLIPDFLVMTATPIPRSLSLTIYGDLDVSIIDEMPPNVGEIETKWMKEEKIEWVWERVISEIKKGNQAYIVYPLIEESDTLSLKSAQEWYIKLSETVFKDYKTGLLHGRLKPAEKAKIMEDFRNKKLDILVCTTVIEVGIDVPNATCMVIEHAERFGLAQLHQLRGRLRRGSGKSLCILVTPNETSDIAKIRLQTIVNEKDGFKLAERDLELRGIGEFFGTKQHGFNKIKFSNIFFDVKEIQRIKGIVEKILEEDPRLWKEENRSMRGFIFKKFKNKVEFLEAG
jgi:ATP-dependent DNA helicase RecG